MSCSSDLRRLFQVYAERPCLRAGNEWWSYGEVGAAASAMCGGLTGVVAICAPNCVEWVVLDLACALAGVPTVVCDPDRDDTRGAAARAASAIGLELSMFVTEPSLRATSGPCNKPSRWLTCMFSSGSTGRPSPCWFDGEGWLEPGAASAVCGVVAPLFHAMGRRQVWRQLATGGAIILANSVGDLRDATSLAAAPRYFEMLRRDGLERGWFPKMQFVSVSGAVCDRALLEFLRGVFDKVSVSYGTTELGGISRDGDVLPGVEVKLEDVQDDVGEIVARTTRVAARRNEWVRTGDLGRWRGRLLEVVDRKGVGVKLANGEFVAPSRLEALFEARCPSVDSCAARVEDGALVCVVVPTARQTPADLAQEMGRVPGLLTYERPSKIIVADRLSRTPLGKLVRNFDAAASVRHFLLDHDDTLRPGPDATAQTFGLDSVAIARLAAELDATLKAAGLRASDLMRTPLVELRAIMMGERRRCDWDHEVAATDVLLPKFKVPPVVVEDATTVVLVGCTGFLGPELHDVLRRRFARVVTLARRCGDVAVDLARPDLGLSERDYARLRGLRVDLIVHAAARVDHARSYAELKPVNVSAVDRLVDVFGSTERCPVFCFVSSLSAAGTGEEAIVGDVAPKMPYAATKWVAERRLERRARDQRTIRLRVARLGMLSPRSPERRNDTDWIHLFCRAALAAQALPLANEDDALDLLPVDVAARGVLALCDDDDDDDDVCVANMDGRAFGLDPVPWRSIFDALRRTRPLVTVPYSEWRRRVLATSEASTAVLLLLRGDDSSADSVRLPAGERQLCRDRARTLLPPSPASFSWDRWARGLVG